MSEEERLEREWQASPYAQAAYVLADHDANCHTCHSP